MRLLTQALEDSIRVEDILIHSEKYLAHIPKPGDPADKKAETLGEHVALVVEQAVQICRMHGLDGVVDKMIAHLTKRLEFNDLESAYEWITDLFANAIVFHDFGKVNEFFQKERMKNSDPMFNGRLEVILTPSYGHSELGAYIYAVYHFEKLAESPIDEPDKIKLAVLVLLFSNTILLHHSSRLVQPQSRIDRSQVRKLHEKLVKYISCYKGFPLPNISTVFFERTQEFWKENNFPWDKVDFSLFGLLRLNFSMLTASDYLATWHYGYGMAVSTSQQWGVFDERRRDAIIQAARTEMSYNKHAYELYESGQYQLRHPMEPAPENLNVLRTEMTIEVLRQLAQNQEKRLFYLEAPTGGGKTNLSMLAVAELLRMNPELNKVFYVFPFTTLITQTHRAIKETLMLQEDDIALLHSRAGFQTLNELEVVDSEDNEANQDGLFGDKKRDYLQNLFVLYPFTLMTHIRFFDALKSQKKDDIYLMHRLANSIVVLDELQSYPPKQWDKILFLLDSYSRFLNIRFILMSATLPRLDRIEAVQRASEQPLPEVMDLLPNPKRYFINPNFKNRVSFRFDLLENNNVLIELPELATFVLNKSKERASVPENNGRVFTIVEFIFKKSASAFKREFETHDPFFDEVFVLSGTTLESQRRHIISWLKRNQHNINIKVLLITTQVVEAGVDIDMDLGFKNISLIDSDEQLAGRVNRNVRKKNCEVWLFNANEARVLYGKDLRYEAMREMKPEERRAVLEDKNFEDLYNRVFNYIEKKNNSNYIENFYDYYSLVKQLDFVKADESFKLIDQQSISVFVPLKLPIQIENENGKTENFFTQNEEKFLQKLKIWLPGDQFIDGSSVWSHYRASVLNKDKTADYVISKIEQKTLQGILSKFTFSLFENQKNRLGLRNHCDPEDSFENYFYLSRYVDLYSIETGLDELKLNNPDIIF
jgi:CRISPR-associated endonuclease/helicase Cas3